MLKCSELHEESKHIRGPQTDFNRNQQGPQRNFVDISPINIISPISFYHNRMGNGNDDISSNMPFENSISLYSYS